MIKMQMGGLGFDPRNMSPIVLLKDFEERNFLPIWIGMFEAAAIAMEIQGYSPPRPMTHDLMINLIQKTGLILKKIVISDVKEDTFYSFMELIPEDLEDENIENEDIIRIDARPSDAIALAVRTEAALFVSETVMMKARMVNTEKDNEETKKFKDFVKNINPDDFKTYFEKI